eukprot:scaffold47_cov258-Pinguiococcus_pyrenoidosus.AAC.104
MREDDAFDEADPAETLETWTREADLDKALDAAANREEGTTVQEVVTKRLRILNLEAKRVGSMDAGLKDFENLRILNLDHNLLEAVNLGCLPPKIQMLSAYACDATKIVLPSLEAETTMLWKLQRLWLGCNNIDYVPSELGDLCPSLMSVDLSYNAISSFSSVLPALRPLLQLKHLSLCGCPLALMPAYRDVFVGVLRQLAYLDESPLPAPATPAKVCRQRLHARPVTDCWSPFQAEGNAVREKFGLHPEDDPFVLEALDIAKASDAEGTFAIRVRLESAEGLPELEMPELPSQASDTKKGKKDDTVKETPKPSARIKVRASLPPSLCPRSSAGGEAMGPSWGVNVDFKLPEDSVGENDSTGEEVLPAEKDLLVQLPSSALVRDHILLHGLELQVFKVAASPPTQVTEEALPDENAEGDVEVPKTEQDVVEEEILVGRGVVPTESLLSTRLLGAIAVAPSNDGKIGLAVETHASVHERCLLSIETTCLRKAAEDKVRSFCECEAWLRPFMN